MITSIRRFYFPEVSLVLPNFPGISRYLDGEIMMPIQTFFKVMRHSINLELAEIDAMTLNMLENANRIRYHEWTDQMIYLNDERDMTVKLEKNYSKSLKKVWKYRRFCVENLSVKFSYSRVRYVYLIIINNEILRWKKYLELCEFNHNFLEFILPPYLNS
jgi:hypothetical protein